MVYPGNNHFKEYLTISSNKIMLWWLGSDGEFNKLVKIDSTNLTNNTSGLLKGPKEFGYDIKLSASKIDSTAKVNAGNTIFNKVKEEIPENMKFRTKYGELKAPEIIEKKISVTSSQPMQEGSNKMMPLNPLNIVPYRLKFKIHESSASSGESRSGKTDSGPLT